MRINNNRPQGTLEPLIKIWIMENIPRMSQEKPKTVTRNTEVIAGSAIKKIPNIRAKMPSTRTIHQGNSGALAAVCVLLTIRLYILLFVNELVRFLQHTE